ncbi:hypothetical protein QAD02_003626 [Eretmocerus hayati]|uniref:Uncharacterized protein n=1 Tax=Eretmocerus hayati TaxID=131215 RepID=A0ACC2NMQ8_9HYME|nr:hypothetical protein QAD02_003626 [Eretmocerus hayati]
MYFTSILLDFRATVNTFLVLDLIGCCCVYVVFVGSNLKDVADLYLDNSWDLRIFMAILLPFLIIFSLIRNLKYLAPFSMIANGLIAAGLGITFYYIFTDLPPIKDIPKVATMEEMPLFFGIAIFALEGIGVEADRAVDKEFCAPQYSLADLYFRFSLQSGDQIPDNLDN